MEGEVFRLGEDGTGEGIGMGKGASLGGGLELETP